MNYAQVSIFGRYLVDHFGPEILSDTLKDKYAGMSSINNFLRNKKTGLTFFDIFKNWMIASFINDGSQNKYYGYLNEELKSLKTNPDEVIDIRSLDFYTLNYKLKSWRPYYSKININIPAGKSLKLSYQSSDFRIAYLDNLGRSGALLNNAYITNPGGLEYFVLMPINQSVGEKSLSLNMEMVDASNSSNLTLSDGALIKKVGESEIYVISGKYKRYLVADVIKMYGHLDQNSALEVDDATFNSFITANYVKSENNKKVYSVWPDGTKHWLNMSGEIFSASGRDWGSIFTINDSELNYYKEGAQIKK
jgi:hypothetical protein